MADLLILIRKSSIQTIIILVLNLQDSKSYLKFLKFYYLIRYKIKMRLN